MEEFFLETERFYLRKMDYGDFSDISDMLKNPEVMYAWEYDFTDEDVKFWIDKNIDLYEKYNCGYFLICDKQTRSVQGQAAVMPDQINGKDYYEIGYILKRENWGRGYAYECAKALALYAFRKYPDYEVILEIRPENYRSLRVAERLNAVVAGEFDKNVRGKIMKHLIYKLDCDKLNYSEDMSTK